MEKPRGFLNFASGNTDPYHMADFNLKGMGVALVTPFKKDKSIDWESLGRLIERQISSGTDYLVVLGTTGETPTLSDKEKEEIRTFVRDRVDGRLRLVLGMGGNDTRALTESLRATDMMGYDAVLSVVPCYNKPSQEGIYQHYAAVAEASPLPVVLYNVPGRTGVNMTAETTLRLARDFGQIVGVKEASGNFGQIEEIIRYKPAGFQVISGDDGITYPLMTLGAVGVISVIGNAFPKTFGKMVRLCLEDSFMSAVKIHYRFTELFNLMFVDGNPAGVKCALNALGLIENELRLPLVPTRLSTNERIHHILEGLTELSES